MSNTLGGILSDAAKNAETLKATLTAARDALVKAKDDYPDLAPQIDPQIADLDAKIAAVDEALTPEKIAGIAAALPAEILDIVHGHIHPADHAGDAI